MYPQGVLGGADDACIIGRAQQSVLITKLWKAYGRSRPNSVYSNPAGPGVVGDNGARSGSGVGGVGVLTITES